MYRESKIGALRIPRETGGAAHDHAVLHVLLAVLRIYLAYKSQNFTFNDHN
jgi:hypothetical protein